MNKFKNHDTSGSTLVFGQIFQLLKITKKVESSTPAN